MKMNSPTKEVYREVCASLETPSCPNSLGLLQPCFRIEVFQRWPQQYLPSHALLECHGAGKLHSPFPGVGLSLLRPIQRGRRNTVTILAIDPTKRLPFLLCGSPEPPHTKPMLGGGATLRCHLGHPATGAFSDSSLSRHLTTTI